MSSWLRNAATAALRTKPSFSECEPDARFQTFCGHWKQVEDIIRRTGSADVPTQDDVLGVVGHLDHMATLLLLETRDVDDAPSEGVCLERLLASTLLDSLLQWGRNAGRYTNAVRVQQIKLYTLLIAHRGRHPLCAESFLRPLLKLLEGFKTELLPDEVEGQLVSLLGQLCVTLTNEPQLVDLFFYPLTDNDIKNSSFLPISLLMSYVHREGSLGQRARAALLLCAALSARNDPVADFILSRSNVCPLLATGLSGLYSLLPRKIDISRTDWHRLTPDDVNDVSKLGPFLNSLEFCNAVAQAAHPSVQQQLLDYFYRGFLIPVVGPALLQTGVDEQIAAVAYLELSLRSVSEPGLLKSLVRFLLDKNYDDANILDTVVPFINGEPQLSIVTISLLETLIDLNCEDLMLELVLKFLINGDHLMVSHRQKSLECDFECRAPGMFLSLSPNCCSVRPKNLASRRGSYAESRKVSVSSLDQNSSGLTSISEQDSLSSTTSTITPQSSVAYGLNANESLYGNYHAYLCEARKNILSCKKACLCWSAKYDNFIKQNTTSKIANESEYSNHAYTNSGKDDSLQSTGESSGYESFKYKSEDHPVTSENESNVTDKETKVCAEESFWKAEMAANSSIFHPLLSKKTSDEGVPSDLNEIDIGPLLTNCLERLGKYLDNDMFVNLRITSLISKLATYPLPILRSFLLSPWTVPQPVVTSLYQILVSIKQQTDEAIAKETECSRLLEEGQIFLIDREIRLANTRKNAIESSGVKNQNPAETGKNALLTSHVTGQNSNNSDTVSLHSLTPEHSTSSLQPMTIYEPFKRSEPKRRSFSSSLTSMFTRRLNAGAITAPPQNTNHSPKDSSPSRVPQNVSSSSSMPEDNLWQSTPSRRLIVNALILDEWIKELGALSQEHVICSISDSIPEPAFEIFNLTGVQNKFL